MLFKENFKFLHNHYVPLAKKEIDPQLNYLFDIKFDYLTNFPREQNIELIAAGQHDNLLDINFVICLLWHISVTKILNSVKSQTKQVGSQAQIR